MKGVEEVGFVQSVRGPVAYFGRFTGGKFIAGSSNFSLVVALAGTQVPAAFPTKLQNSTTPSLPGSKTGFDSERYV